MVALLGGCQQTASETITGPIMVEMPAYEAEGPIWVLYHLNGQSVPVAPRPAGLRFHGPTARVYGTSGLNKFSGGYRINSTSLSFQPMVRETQLAGTPEQGALEQELLATLGRVTVWRIQEGVLVLLEGTKPVAYLMRHPEQPTAK